MIMGQSARYDTGYGAAPGGFQLAISTDVPVVALPRRDVHYD